MTSYRTKEEVEKEVKYLPVLYNASKGDIEHFQSFVTKTRLSDLESIIEDVDGLFEDEMIVKSDGHPFRMKKVKCDENVALDSAKKSVLSYLKSLKQ